LIRADLRAIKERDDVIKDLLRRVQKLEERVLACSRILETAISLG
jgi:hypothetical protein